MKDMKVKKHTQTKCLDTRIYSRFASSFDVTGSSAIKGLFRRSYEIDLAYILYVYFGGDPND